MRKAAKQSKTRALTSVQGYHQGGSYTDVEQYAYAGFGSNKYFTSDRFMPLDANFRRMDGKPLKGFGLEIETECRGVTNSTVYAEILQNVVFTHFPADLFKMQRDGSLGGDTSAECITQVMTKEFIRNNYANFKLMYDTYFPAFGVSCSRSGNCGMHINISNGCFGKSENVYAVAIRKLFYIVNKHYYLCCALFNRDSNHTGYCARQDYANAQTLDLSRMSCSHGVCFNMGHYNAGRIELRLVGGQTNYACFRNTMESVFHLVDRVKTISWTDCDDVTKIFAGCNQYVFDRLKSKCYDAGQITTAQLETIKATVQREELL